MHRGGGRNRAGCHWRVKSNSQPLINTQQSDLYNSRSTDMMAGDRISRPRGRGHSMRGTAAPREGFSRGGRYQNSPISTEKDVRYTQHHRQSGRGRVVHRNGQGTFPYCHVSNENEANDSVSGHYNDSVSTGGAPVDNEQEVRDSIPIDAMVRNESLEAHSKDYCRGFSDPPPVRFFKEVIISHSGQILRDIEGGDSVLGHSDTVPTGDAPFDSRQNLRDSTSVEMMASNKSSGQSDNVPQTGEAFDICPIKIGGPPKLKASLQQISREKRNELARSSEGRLLRRGMVLLKNFLSNSEQIDITKTCRDLGIGDGGFYQPGYNDGAKLRLKMMCLGKNWDPQTRLYEESRSIDGAAIPHIPEDFKALVEKAIRDSHALIKRELKENNAEHILPWMKPDICIVNFYTETGKLGLHQDRDESEESLYKGLPVVSFSIGDSAEFLYGDSRDVEKAEKVVLESGDVLIFGGEARHVFHGVPSINQGTAPKFLNEATNLRPGRLNLTFRQY